MVRTAGQVIDDAVLGSLEYSVSVLGVPLIVVLGHDRCGAVTATKNAVETGQMPVGFMRSLVERITPSVLTSLRNNQDDVNDMVVENVKQTSQRLVDSSRVISDAVDSGRTAVIGLAYSLADGKADLVSGIGEAVGPAAARPSQRLPGGAFTVFGGTPTPNKLAP